MKAFASPIVDMPELTQAACRDTDPEVFFPLGGTNQELTLAREICAGCPDRHPCVQYALASDVLGVWGGTTYEDRKRLRATQRTGRARPLMIVGADVAACGTEAAYIRHRRDRVTCHTCARLRLEREAARSAR